MKNRNYTEAKEEWESYPNESPEFRLFMKLCDINDSIWELKGAVHEESPHKEDW